jgi:methionine sulfoxide reductase heme-binding subunit
MASSVQHGRGDRRQVFALIALAVAAACVVPLLIVPDKIEAVRLVIRITARISLTLFLAAFLASTIAKLWPGGLTRWLLANRRVMGLGFAWSHLIHAGALVFLYRADKALFWSLTNPVSVAGGTIAYGFIAALAFTSFDGAVRALGPHRWRRLHTTGLWIIWLVFLISNAKRIPISAGYIIPSMIVIAALALRIYGARQNRSAATT